MKWIDQLSGAGLFGGCAADVIQEAFDRGLRAMIIEYVEIYGLTDRQNRK
jgi:hypothetical protein